MAEVSLEVRRLLDAHHWEGSTGRLGLLAFDVDLRAEDARMTDLLDDLYAPLRRPGEAEHVLSVRAAGNHTRPSWEVHLDGVRVLRTRAASIAFRHLLWEANQQAIERTSDRVLVHAAAVARGDSALVLAGPMGAGKSTLAAALVAAGLGYLTDEVVALDPDTGLVHPYPKYLSVGPALAHLAPPVPAATRTIVGDQHLVPVAAIRADPLAGPSRPRVVVLPRYERGADVVLEPLAPADALSAVAEHTFHLDRDGPRVLATVAAMVEGSSCWSLVSGDVAGARDALLEVLA
jgi:hypothetical protein